MASSNALADAKSVAKLGPGRHQVNQACERCRKTKLKCSGRTPGDYPSCKRCTNGSLTCVFMPCVARGRDQKRREWMLVMENELKQMKSIVEELQKPKTLSSGATTPASRSTAVDGLSSNSVHLPPVSALSMEAEYHASHTVSEGDPMFWGIVSLPFAEALLETFRHLALPQYPILAVPPDRSFADLNAEQPILLLAMVTAGCSAFEPDLFEKLHQQLVRQVVERVFIDGQRSLELLQAIVILEAWYYPPHDLKKLNFYQWIHVAGTMAQQLGLGGQTLRTTQENVQIQSDREMERFRTMFSVYEACSSVAMSMHRQPMLQFPASAHQYLSAFESRSTLLNDARLAAWVKLQVISQEVEVEKVNYISQRKKDTDQMLAKVHSLGNRFQAWEQDMGDDILTLSLKVQFHYSKAKLYELVIFAFHNAENLVPPFLNSNNSPSSDGHVNVVSPPYIKAVMALIDACHGMLKSLRSRNNMDLRCCPTITFVRCVYAVKILSLLQQTIKQPRHAITQILDDDSIGLKNHVESFITSLEAASGTKGCRVPSMIAEVVHKITRQPSSNTDSDPSLAINDSSVAAATETPCQGNGTDLTQPIMSDQDLQFMGHSWPSGCDSLIAMQPRSDLEEMLFPEAFWPYSITDGMDYENFGLV